MQHLTVEAHILHPFLFNHCEQLTLGLSIQMVLRVLRVSTVQQQ